MGGDVRHATPFRFIAVLHESTKLWALDAKTDVLSKWLSENVVSVPVRQNIDAPNVIIGHAVLLVHKSISLRMIVTERWT